MQLLNKILQDAETWLAGFLIRYAVVMVILGLLNFIIDLPKSVSSVKLVDATLEDLLRMEVLVFFFCCIIWSVVFVNKK